MSLLVLDIGNQVARFVGSTYGATEVNLIEAYDGKGKRVVLEEIESHFAAMARFQELCAQAEALGLFHITWTNGYGHLQNSLCR